MNRFVYTDPVLNAGENTVAVENNVRLYDGDQKTSFEGGELIITSHRIFWGRPGTITRGQSCLALHLSLVIFVEEESPSAFSFSRSRKVVLHLAEYGDGRHGPQMTSLFNYIKFSFREGFSNPVPSILNDLLQKRLWDSLNISQELLSSKPQVPTITLRSGIVGIERSIQEKQKAADDSINIAFQDLDKLITMAKDMVKLSKKISTKFKEKQGDITEDETIRFKSYLLSLGIDDPVTRDSQKSDNQYFSNLAKQICDFLLPHVEEMCGMMSLADVFCRVNRARSLELLSPGDILTACKLMESLRLPLKLFEFSSGVMVLQLTSLDSESIAESTAVLIEENGSLSAEELSQKLGISIQLAKERLLTTEKLAKCCRDDSIEGLKFYPNRFFTED